jgi:hypothetical protein
VLRARIVSLAFAALLPLAVAGCGGHTNVVRSVDRCNQQIILSLSPGLTRTRTLIKQLARDTHVHLQYVRSTSPNLHVFMLSSTGRDPECDDALVSLRQDSRVRFAEIDERRSYLDAAN